MQKLTLIQNLLVSYPSVTDIKVHKSLIWNTYADRVNFDRINVVPYLPIKVHFSNV